MWDDDIISGQHINGAVEHRANKPQLAIKQRKQFRHEQKNDL